MKIIIDAMGGDNAPKAMVQGALLARKEWPDTEIVLTGREEAIRAAAVECGAAELPEGITIRPASEVIEMSDDPAMAFKRKKDSSMTVGLNMLRDGEGDAFISAGSTGALLSGATLVVKRIRGIRRAAMAPVIPSSAGQMVLCDCGANAECTAEYLLQFAFLGSFFAKRMLGIEQPRVGLLNIGAEEEKGDALRHETFALLQAADAAGRIHFIGNVEASTAMMGGADVVVADGFAGNVLLKGIEGTAKMMSGVIKKMFLSSGKTKVAALLVKNEFGAVKKMLDPNEVGGTPFLGISKPVLKAHGSSDARAVFNAVRQARSFAASGFIDDIEANIDYMRLDRNGERT